jgi:alpha-L-fucosidase
MHAQRIYNDRKWPNPIVLKLTNVEPALSPPAVTFRRAAYNAATRTATLEGELTSLGKASEVEVAFEYRNVKGLDLTERPDAYNSTPYAKRSAPGVFTATVPGWEPGDVMEIRAAVKHPLITTYSREQRFSVR